MSKIYEFETVQLLRKQARTRIKLFYISQLYWTETYFGIYVTQNDDVYGFGENCSGQLGQGDMANHNDFVKLKELSKQNISEIYEGNCCMFAVNNSKQIFSWGGNNWGQLGRKHLSGLNEFFAPKLIPFFTGIQIETIYCGNYHNLALSKFPEIRLFGWGGNNFSQLGLKGKLTYNIPISIKIPLTIGQSILSINCFLNSNFVCLSDKSVYFWGEDKWNIIREEAGQIVEEVKKVIRIPEASVIIPNTESLIFTKQPGKISTFSNGKLTSESEYWINKIDVNEDDKFIVDKDDKIWVFDKDTFIDTGYSNFTEYYNWKYNRSYKTTHLIIEEKNHIKSLLNFMDDIQSISNEIVTERGHHAISSYIKCFYKSIKNSDENIVIYVTNNNFVYVFGESKYGKLGLGDSKNVKEFKNLKELNGLFIEEFFEGQCVMFARTNNNHIYGWGKNCFRELQQKNDEIYKPINLLLLNNKNIVQICCGNHHCLALSANGSIYTWGSNSFGQLGVADKDISEIPIEIKLSEEPNLKFKFIHTYENSSFAISFDSFPYFWGWTDTKNIPITKLKKVKNALKIGIFKSFCYIIKEDGTFIKYRLNEEIEVEVDNPEELKFKDFIIFEGIFLETEECVYEFECRKNIFIKMDYLNLFRYFYLKENSTYKSIKIINEEYLITKLNPKIKDQQISLTFEDKKIMESRFESNFNILDEIGAGGYGTVYKVNNLLTGDLFAVKRIEYKDEKVLREIEINSKLDSDFVVRYYQYWEEKFKSIDGYKHYIFMQMEFCEKNLRNVIELLYKSVANNYQIIKFFLSGELFKELAKCVNYLHENKIIHRDLKPENVLISFGKGGSCLKLCDFGLAKFEESSTSPQSQKSGTFKYMAPEYSDLKIYNSYSDVYSLAYIGVDLFNIGDNDNEKIEQKQLLKNIQNFSKGALKIQYTKLYEILSSCIYANSYKKRPKCQNIVEKIDEIMIDAVHLTKEKNKVLDFMQSLKNKNLNYIELIFKNKIGNDLYAELLLVEDPGKNKDNQILDPSIENNFDDLKKKTRTTRFDEEFKFLSWIENKPNIMKVENKKNKKIYAFKQYELRNEKKNAVLREIKILSKLSNEYIVNYINHWVEKIRPYGDMLYIQMEYHMYTLSDLISIDKFFFKKFKIFNYFICCELFKEIIECVHYIHHNKIIHRHIKLEEFLFSNGTDGIFLKLCDFGMAVFHEKSRQLHTTFNDTEQEDRAPEIGTSNYTDKVDIYSIGVCGQRLFHCEEHWLFPIENHGLMNPGKIFNSAVHDNKVKSLCNELFKCLIRYEPKKRPSCKDLKTSYKSWAFETNTILNNKNLLKFKEELNNPDYSNWKLVFEKKISIKSKK